MKSGGHQSLDPLVALGYVAGATTRLKLLRPMTAPGFSGRIAFMNLQDATLVFLIESQQWPSVATIAQSVYGRLLDGEVVDYRLLDDLIGEASGKGVLRALRQKYDPIAFEAILSPIMDEIARTKPIRSTRPEWQSAPGEDPLTVRR
jgi:hypothetical protein